MRPRWAARALVVVGVGASVAPSCRPATEITLALSTDVACGDLRGSSVTIGTLGDIETKPPAASATSCDASGDLGALVVVPSGGRSDEVAMKIVAAIGRDVGSCVPPYGKGCIVARRAIRFVPHTGLRIEVPLRRACDGIACAEAETCVNGACVDAEIADPSSCASPTGCDEGALDGGAPDGASDAGPDTADVGVHADSATTDGPITPTYHDMSDLSAWTAYSPGSALQMPWREGVAVVGRYVYFSSHYINGSTDATILRYDTGSAFGAVTSWSEFDPSTIVPSTRTFTRALSDGRYVYLLPSTSGLPPASDASGLVFRHDSQAALGNAAAWSTFDLTSLKATFTQPMASAFDGRFVYLLGSFVARYDTTAPFGEARSWTSAEASALTPQATYFTGAAFDGHYVYSGTGQATVARHDVSRAVDDASSWTTFTTTPLGAGPLGAIAYDGAHVYFFGNPVIARYTVAAGPFDVASSWSTFDLSALSLGVETFYGTTFDGRFLYLTPDYGNGKPATVLVRYDTLRDLKDPASWSTFDLAPLGTFGGYSGAAFDGKYVYLCPFSSVTFLRFDARTPGAPLPFTPSFF